VKRLWPFALLVVLGALLFWGLRRGDPSALPSVLVGKPAPDFTLPAFAPYRAEWGERIQLSRYLGQKPILVNLWASWCVPCRDEAPMLEAAWRQYKDRLLILGVNVQDTNPGAALGFIQEFGLTFPSGIDENGRVWIDYGGYGVPETFLIGKDGKVLYRHAGPLDPATLQELLGKVL
jgi:cytochrome c biogenesis protein CcmG/thiol:disulfide interchange protein DsbE